MNKNEYKLSSELLKMSESSRWNDAKLEWSYCYSTNLDEPTVCMCGHSPIYEMCVLENRKTGSIAVVGNVCVTKFMGIDAVRCARNLKKIKDNIQASVDVGLIENAYIKGFINEWKRTFYLDVRRKRKLSSKQQIKKTEINLIILNAFDKILLAERKD